MQTRLALPKMPMQQKRVCHWIPLHNPRLAAQIIESRRRRRRRMGWFYENLMQVKFHPSAIRPPNIPFSERAPWQSTLGPVTTTTTNTVNEWTRNNGQAAVVVLRDPQLILKLHFGWLRLNLNYVTKLSVLANYGLINNDNFKGNYYGHLLKLTVITVNNARIIFTNVSILAENAC